jgi:hypothetical protein
MDTPLPSSDAGATYDSAVYAARDSAGSSEDVGVGGESGTEGGSDAAIPDSAHADAAPAMPDLCAADGGATFCEGFEAPLGPDWTVYNGTYGNGCGGHSVGLGQRDTSRSHSGAASWHANVDYVDIGSCQAELRRAVVLPSPDTFVRMFVYVPKATLSAITNSVEIGMFYESHGGFGAVGPTLFGDTLGVDGYGDVIPPQARDASPFPTDRWVCIEWQLHQGPSPTVTVWRDGALVLAPSRATLPTAEPLDGSFFGIYGYDNSGNVDVWFDDVALAASPIGCQ